MTQLDPRYLYAIMAKTYDRVSACARLCRTSVLALVGIGWSVFAGGIPLAEARFVDVTREGKAPTTASESPSPQQAQGDDAAQQPSLPLPSSSPTDLPLWVGDIPLLRAQLPGGLQTRIAQDTSLPVASVILAFPVGYADDPDDRSGLMRALALHLEQGNRELRPGGRLSVIHGAGGHTRLAVGAKQTRLEALFPVGLLPEVLAGLAQFSWSPTVTPFRWQQSVERAAQDKLGRPSIGNVAVSRAWKDPKLKDAGRVAIDALVAMQPDDVRQALTTAFDLRRATLVVVTPMPPDRVLPQLREAFSNLRGTQVQPRQDGRTLPSAVEQTTAQSPAELRVLWPIAGDYAALWHARVLCGALNRQPRLATEPPRLVVRCRLHEDPKRPVLQVTVKRAGQGSPRELLRSRMSRLIDDPADQAVLTIERERQARNLAAAVSTPLSLASLLTRFFDGGTMDSAPMNSLNDALGIVDLTTEDATFEFIRELLSRWSMRDDPGPLTPSSPENSSSDPKAPTPTPPEVSPSPVLEQGAIP